MTSKVRQHLLLVEMPEVIPLPVGLVAKVVLSPTPIKLVAKVLLETWTLETHLIFLKVSLVGETHSVDKDANKFRAIQSI